jgi:hypothetical protein
MIIETYELYQVNHQYRKQHLINLSETKLTDFQKEYFSRETGLLCDITYSSTESPAHLIIRLSPTFLFQFRLVSLILFYTAV